MPKPACDLHGVIPPIITPYDANGRLHEVAFRELVDWYASAGCQGIWVCGGTGEGTILSREERNRMAELSHEAAAGRLQVVFHVGAASTDDAVSATRRCQELGVDAICSVPPFFYGKSDAETIEYYRRLGDETDRPILLYNLPDATGRPLTVSLVAEIVDRVTNVVGMKQSAPQLDLIVELLRIRPELNILVGRGELMLAALVLGARGCVCASLCMAPDRFLKLYEAFVAGDLRQAMTQQKHATRVKELFLHYSVIGATKRVNSLQTGIDCGPPRGPVAPISAEEDEAFCDLARDIGLIDANAELTAAHRSIPR